MKKRIRFIVEIIIIALVVGLLIWRFWPRSSSYLISVDEHSFTGFSAIATVSYIEDGVPYSNIYRIENTPQYREVLEEVLEILATSRYRPDFRNLLPGGLRQIDGGKKYDGRIISLAFSAETQEGFVHIQFLSSSIVSVHIGNESGFRIYHPTNRNTLDKLVEYLQTNGVTSEEHNASASKYSVYYSLDYSYCVDGDVYVAKETLQALETFGKPEYIIPAEPETQVYTQLPDVENNAKGREPISFVLPEFDLTHYSDAYYRQNPETDTQTVTYYRMMDAPLNGLRTDEMIHIYVDSSGNITQYETVNLGKYDRLKLDEGQLVDLQKEFSNAITSALNTQPKNFQMFTDTQGRIVLTATAQITQARKLIEVTLYAVVHESLRFP